MLRFNDDAKGAYIYADSSTEDGWIIRYGGSEKLFLIWSDVYYDTIGSDPTAVCETLEEALAEVRTYT